MHEKKSESWVAPKRQVVNLWRLGAHEFQIWLVDADLWFLTRKILTCIYLTCAFQNVVSKMKRDMKQLEDQAAASARSARAEKEHSLQLEKDLDRKSVV